MAYALVVSLKRTLDPLLDSARSKIQIPNLELKVLNLIHDDLCDLKSFLDKMNSLKDSNSVEELEKYLKDVLEKAQDLIESHLSVKSKSQSSRDESSISGFAEELVKVKDMLKAKKDELTKLKAEKEARLKAKKDEMLEAEEDDLTGDQQSPGIFSVSAEIDSGRNHMLVGLGDELLELKEWLLGGSSRLQLISIVGMGGSGKTTLAKEVYLDPLTIEYCDVRLFVEIGLKYELRELLLRILGLVVPDKRKGLTVDKLVERLYNFLSGKRYVVVLDDIWDTSVWDQLRRVFPDNGNGSSVICTTRLLDGVRDGFHEENILQKRCLNYAESWDLLCNMAFSDREMRPLELEEIGKTIAENLNGLPVAIVEIGKRLSILPPTVESWNEVAQNISWIRETTIAKILNPYYAQLPQHLKACFLYMGLFQPNYNIPTSLLFRLWIAEGFIVPVSGKYLEQVAEEYLEDLVSKNLVIVHQLSSTGRIRTCRIHQLLQDLCVSEARNQKLFHIVNGGSTTSFPQGAENQRRLGVHSNVVLGFRQVHSAMESVPAARSLLCVGPQQQNPIQMYLGFRWLRVLHALSIIFRKFPDEVPKLVRLRYLAITYNGELPSSISRLLDLEVLIIRPSQSIKSFIFLPLDIWKLQKLRHLECIGYDLPDPSTGDGNGGSGLLLLEGLLTLSGVSGRSCTEGVLERMPNLIKLGIWSEPTHHAVENMCSDAVSIHLQKLESFKCVSMNYDLPSEAAFSLASFANGLRKLTLSGCGFLWDKHMTVIAQLELLQVLKLRRRSFCGPEWESFDGGFLRLKVLVLEDLDIEQLTAQSYSFPVLEQLLIRHCYKLREIPSEIGEIPTLSVIDVDDCSMSLMASARHIREEQISVPNLSIKKRHIREEQQIDDLLNLYKKYHYSSHTYSVYSVEENPNACIIQ